MIDIGGRPDGSRLLLFPDRSITAVAIQAIASRRNQTKMPPWVTAAGGLAEARDS